MLRRRATLPMTKSSVRKAGSRRHPLAALGAVGMAMMVGLAAGGARASQRYGRLTGSVTDAHGAPLMGVTVWVMGPGLGTGRNVGGAVERVITDAQGKFALERLLPGRYSIRVAAFNQMPVFRSGVRVAAGQTASQSFVLGDIVAPLRIEVPSRSSLARAGEDWKWVLRASDSTRPILRYKPGVKSRIAGEASQRLIAMIPGPTRHDPLASDSGMGSVLAYLRPLSADADLLVAGSMTPDGLATSSVVTALRRNVFSGDPQELALVVHQLNLAPGAPIAGPQARQALANAQGVVLSYSQTHHLSDALTVTGGLEMDYLNAWPGAMIARPHATVQFALNGANVVTARYGATPIGRDETLLDRIGELNAFPLMTMHGHHPALTEANHAEVSWAHQINRRARVEVAAYRDDFQNAVVKGSGRPERWGWADGNYLPNLNANGMNLDAGSYHSTGVRATLSAQVGRHAEADVMYASGEALAARSAAIHEKSPQVNNLRGLLENSRSQSVGGRLVARVPRSGTRVLTSYVWMEHGRVTDVDPYGEAALEVEPYLCLQIRQPIPAFGFLPAHIEALADFRNLLAQGYTRLGNNTGEEPLILTAAYRSFRGGFAVQF